MSYNSAYLTIWIAKVEKYILNLTNDERNELLKLIKIGKGAASKLMHARVLLAIDAINNSSDEEISNQLNISTKTVQRIRKTAVLDGLENALNRKKYSSNKRVKKINGEVEAHLVALSCSTPPEGRCRWTLNLLANQLVQLEIIDSVSPASVQRALKKMNLSHG